MKEVGVTDGDVGELRVNVGDEEGEQPHVVFLTELRIQGRTLTMTS